MQLAIAQNPHAKDPKLLWNEIEHQENELLGRSYLDDTFDEKGFEAFKQTLRQSSRIVIK